MIGGKFVDSHSQSPTTMAELFSFDTMTWRRIEDIPEVNEISLVEHGETILVVGGVNSRPLQFSDKGCELSSEFIGA